MERVRVEEFGESKDDDCGWVNLVFLSGFSLKILSGSSLHFVGIRGIYTGVYGMRRVSFSQTEWTSDLASRLDWVASPSHELTEWPDWTFCLVVLQLAWLFSSPACFTCVHPWATCKLWDLVASPLLSAQSWTFLHTLSHTTLTWFPPKYRVSKY